MPLLRFLLASQLWLGSCVGASFAQTAILPEPGTRVTLSPTFQPPILRGLKVHPEDPFQFEFILDVGEAGHSSKDLEAQSEALIKYFLASMTVPEQDLWVNLSPYEKERIAAEGFGQTEMGRDLLAQDYLLKQITASLIYPEDDIGKKFWQKVYAEAREKFPGLVPAINTFNKVWIVPDKAVVYENANTATAAVVESTLKVMLEADYLAMGKNPRGDSTRAQADAQATGQTVIRDIVLPLLTKEINEGANFAPLRQIYLSLIMAAWYKKKIKGSFLSQVYADKNRIAGITSQDPREKEKIYQQYLKAFKKGVFNYIKLDSDGSAKQSLPRKYFSGGWSATQLQANLAFEASGDKAMRVLNGLGERLKRVAARINPYQRSPLRARDLQKIVAAGMAGAMLMAAEPQPVRSYAGAASVKSSPRLNIVGLRHADPEMITDFWNFHTVGYKQNPSVENKKNFKKYLEEVLVQQAKVIARERRLKDELVAKVARKELPAIGVELTVKELEVAFDSLESDEVFFKGIAKEFWPQDQARKVEDLLLWSRGIGSVLWLLRAGLITKDMIRPLENASLKASQLKALNLTAQLEANLKINGRYNSLLSKLIGDMAKSGKRPSASSMDAVVRMYPAKDQPAVELKLKALFKAEEDSIRIVTQRSEHMLGAMQLLPPGSYVIMGFVHAQEMQPWLKAKGIIRKNNTDMAMSAPLEQRVPRVAEKMSFFENSTWRQGSQYMRTQFKKVIKEIQDDIRQGVSPKSYDHFFDPTIHGSFSDVGTAEQWVRLRVYLEDLFQEVPELAVRAILRAFEHTFTYWSWETNPDLFSADGYYHARTDIFILKELMFLSQRRFGRDVQLNQESWIKWLKDLSKDQQYQTDVFNILGYMLLIFPEQSKPYLIKDLKWLESYLSAVQNDFFARREKRLMVSALSDISDAGFQKVLAEFGKDVKDLNVPTPYALQQRNKAKIKETEDILDNYAGVMNQYTKGDFKNNFEHDNMVLAKHSGRSIASLDDVGPEDDGKMVAMEVNIGPSWNPKWVPKVLFISDVIYEPGHLPQVFLSGLDRFTEVQGLNAKSTLERFDLDYEGLKSDLDIQPETPLSAYINGEIHKNLKDEYKIFNALLRRADFFEFVQVKEYEQQLPKLAQTLLGRMRTHDDLTPAEDFRLKFAILRVIYPKSFIRYSDTDLEFAFASDFTSSPLARTREARNYRIIDQYDPRILAEVMGETSGGIDFKADQLNLKTQVSNRTITMNKIDPAMMEQLRNVAGFVPDILSIQSLTDVRTFLGIGT